MAQQTAVEWLINELESKGKAWENGIIRRIQISIDVSDYLELKRQAKQMEKDKHLMFNDFLETEKTLGISNRKTIERVQWYYNKYYNETYGKDSNEPNA